LKRNSKTMEEEEERMGESKQKRRRCSWRTSVGIWDGRRRRLRRNRKNDGRGIREEGERKMNEGFMQDKFGNLGWEEPEAEEEKQDDGRVRKQEGESKQK